MFQFQLLSCLHDLFQLRSYQAFRGRHVLSCMVQFGCHLFHDVAVRVSSQRALRQVVMPRVLLFCMLYRLVTPVKPLHCIL